MKPTREQVLAEPAGEKLDAWVAEYVMGWKWEKWLGGTRRLLNRPGLSAEDYASGDEPLDNGWAYRVPNYSTDIAAAWLVVEKCKLHITPWGFSDGGYMVTDRHDWNEPGLIHAWGMKAPLPICRAALLAVIDGGE